MNQNLTDVTVLLDRSGSMDACRIEAENGVNHFIEDQKNAAGTVNLTLAQFDNVFEYLVTCKPIHEVQKFHLVPRGMTALLDAVGKLIDDTGVRLASMKEENRPGLVVIAIVTDGQENASQRFTKSQIKSMIERQTSQYKWQFTYLGANQDAFTEAQGLGIQANAVANYKACKSDKTFEALSNNVKRMRSSSVSGQSISCLYTDDERITMD